MRTHPFVRDEPNWSSFRAMLEARESDPTCALAAWRGASYSHADVARYARSVASFLKKRGLEPGQKVILIAENSPEWIITYLGARLLRLVLVPLDCQLGSDEVRTVGAFADADLAFTDADRQTELSHADLPFDAFSLASDGPAFEEIFRSDPLSWESLPDPDPDEVAAIIFTSGTTGDPKGVELTEHNLLGNAQTLARLGVENEGDTMGVVLPLHHAYAFTVGTLAPFVIRAPVVFPQTLKGDLIRRCFTETGVTIFPAVPLLLELMVGGIDRTIRSSPLPARLYARTARKLSRLGRKVGIPLGRLLCRPIRRKIGSKLRLIISAGAALPAEVNEALLDLGFKLVEGYGLTETSPAVAITPLDAPRPGSVGLLIPGAELRFGPPREDGSAEVLVRGPMVMRGYYKRPDLTKDAFEGEFFKTGDLGRFDQDGYLWITGRAKEVIVLPSGKNVYPEDVERHFLEAPSIKEVCVLQDPEKPETIHALVVPEESVVRNAGEQLADRVQYDLEDVATKLPSYLRIGGFTLTLEPLPRTRLGKLKRAEIAAMLPDLRQGVRQKRTLALEEEQLLASHAGAVVMDVLSEVVGRPVHPSEHLELDLSLDSLRRLEVLTRIESTLGVEVDPEVAAQVTRPVDIVSILKDTPATTSGHGKTEAAFSWSEVLRHEPTPPLAAIVTLRPGLLSATFRLLGRAFLKSVLKLRYGLRVEGGEHLPDEPCIVAPNHISLIDAAVMLAALPDFQFRRMCFLAIRTQFESFFRRRLVRPFRIILTDQLGGTQVSLQYGAEALRRGSSLCIFPEGRRAPTREFDPGRPGAGLLARELNVPVIPTLIRGTEVVSSRLPDPPKSSTFSVTFGTPISPEVFRAVEDEKALGAPWDEAVRALRRQVTGDGRARS